MTSHRIGVNLRVSGNCDQGARKYMEDNHVIKFLKKDTDDYEFAYFGIFDGHGGPEASAFCRDHLLNEITKYDGFWTDDDEQVLSAIRKGFLDTHQAMWNVLDTWPKTVTGLPSTAGTTATIAIIKQGKLYTGHVGDSALVLGENDPYGGNPVQAICITKEHKPDDPDERLRIEDAGGEVINKSGVPRVVWSRPKTNHKGPVRRSTQIDQIPFLAVARSLGDLWSYDFLTETYVVSPEPDVSVLKMDPTKHRCLILASDGLWNMLTPEESVNMVMDLEAQFEDKIIHDPNVAVSFWSNPAERLVSRALNKWRSKALKADNTSCVVVLIDPLGPSKLTLLKRKRQELLSGGEITNCQLIKVPTDMEANLKTRNKNANCSLSDSHVRVTDDSIIQPASRNDHHFLRHSMPFGTRSSSRDDSCNESINDSVQYIPKPTVLCHPRHAKPFEINDNKKMDLNSGGDLDIEKPIPQPPPCTPCSDVKELDESGDENSLQSSTDVTDKAFSLASDESIESPSSSFDEANRPPTPQSAPAKLSSARNRRSHISKSTQRKLAKSGRLLQYPPKSLAHSRSKVLTSDSPMKISLAKAENHSKSTRSSVKQASGSVGKNEITRAAERAYVISSKNNTTATCVDTPPRRVLNTSKSMNDVTTPRNQKEVSRAISCTGLTPDMNMLLTNKNQTTLNNTRDACTGSDDLTGQLFSSLMVVNVRGPSRNNASLIIDGLEGPSEPLKQLNKTGPLKKSGSKRWGNFLRASKLSIDHMFNLNNKKDHGPCKLTSTSTGKLERSISKVVTSKTSSMSTSKLSEYAHLPDITVSHLADLTVDASTLTAADYTTLSALSEDDSVLSVTDLTTAHQSMLEDGVQGKVLKHRKGFLQKTRVTLRRARKAAKKAFFPENHRLFNHKSSGSKRKSDEFLPTPDMKRRRQLEAEKV
uniref:PPM-type phosphatase domain-containing protein n=1 Tax=Biomphalaria glabrata TaxID=6526 RepID=A0A182ZIV9_BIOGL